jgi:AraC-like DNA-binding protein
VAVVLDTETLPPRDRAEAVEAAMRYARVPAALSHDPDAAEVRARVETWELGGEVGLVHREGTGISLARTPRQVRSIAEERVSLTLLGPGRWRFAQGVVEQVVERECWGACLVDQSAPYAFQRVGSSRMYAVSIDRDALGIPADAVRKAAGRLDRSPLLAMVTRHVDRHITDADLTPDRIARAHSVSLRTLYAAWAGNALSLAAYIMAQRLELARRALVEPGSRARTIAAVARHYGFVDATHFARRFREAYGLSPREWRQLASRTRTAQPAPSAAQ